MKFTKEDANKELVAKLTAKGEKLNLSERSINEQLDTLIPLFVNDETEISEFVDKVLPIFKVADANVRHDVSVGITTFKETYKPQQTVTTQQQTTTDDANAALLKRLDELENEIKVNKTKAIIQDLRNGFIAKAKEKGVKDDEWLNSYIEELSIGEDFDVEAKAESCLKLYNKSMSNVQHNVSPKGGNGGTTDYLSDAIKEAAALAKSQRLIE